MHDSTASASAARTQRLLAAVLLFGSMGFMAFNAVIGLIARDLGVAEWLVGIVVTASGLAAMATGRFWGRRSDVAGRAPVLRFGLAGNFAGYVALAAFVFWASSARPAPLVVFAGLLVIRVGATLCYAAVQPAAQAFVADVTKSFERSRGMALLGLGSAAGMVMGPAMASAIAPVSLVLPLWAAAITSALALALVLLVAPYAPAAPAADAPPPAFSDPRLRFPLLVAFGAMVCVMSPQVITGFFAQDRFTLASPAAASLAGAALTGVGVALVAASLVVRRVGWAPRRLILTGAPIAAIGFAGVLAIAEPWQMVLGYFVAGFGMGFIFPAFQAEASMAVSDAEQGSALGAVAVAQALGMTVGPLTATLLYRGLGPVAPFLFSAIILVAIFALAAVMRAPSPVMRRPT